MKRRWWMVGAVAAVAAVVLCLVLLSRPKASDTAKEYEEGDLTKNEWMEMLGEHTGVEAEEQSDGDAVASGRFIARSAIQSVGEAKIQRYLGTEKELTEEDYWKVAVDTGLVEESEHDRGFSEERTRELIEKFDELYFDEFWPRDLEEYEYQEGVIELDSSAVLSYDGEAERFSSTAELAAGDVVVFPDNGFVVAGKIERVADDGSFELGQPKLEEVFQSIEQSGVAELSFEDIANYYGEENLTVVQRKSQGQAVAVSHILSGDAQSKGFGIEASAADGKLEISITDHNTGISYQLPDAPEISDEYEGFQASLDVTRIYVGSQLVYSSKEGVRYADVAVDIDTDCKAGLSTGDVVSERLRLFETEIPIGDGTVGVDLQIYLVITLEGEIYLEAEFPFRSAVHYEGGGGITYNKTGIEVEDPRIEASAELETQIEMAAILEVVKLVPVLDAELGVGVSTEATATLHDNGQVCTDVTAAFPVIGLSVGNGEVLYRGEKSLIAWLLEAPVEWELVGAEDAPVKCGLHFEVLPDGTRQFVEECTYQKQDEGDLVFRALRNGDFSSFAGTYKACDVYADWYGGGGSIADLVLRENGSVKGGGTQYDKKPYPSSEPLFVTKNADGSYLCQVTEADSGVENYFLIYPQGVVGESPYEDDQFLKDTVYIHYFQIDGGILDIIYYKEDGKAQDSTASGMDNKLTTENSGVPVFHLYYPDGWSVEQDLQEGEYEWDILSNGRGVKINYYQASVGFGSPYDGGGYVVNSAKVTKVAESSMEGFVVAKVKVYAYDDGLSEDGETEFDGPTYYAVVPKSCLGETYYCGMGYWAALSWEDSSPIAVLAESPDGTYTAAEETEIIQILSSFGKE